MSDDKRGKKHTLSLRMRARSIIFVFLKALLIISIFCSVIFAVQARPSNRIFVNKYATYEVLRTDGTHTQSKNKVFGVVNKGDIVTVHLCLPEEPLLENAVLTFYIYHSVTEISCEGEIIYSYGADIDARGDMVGNARFMLDVPDEAWGGEITIMMRVTEDAAFAQVKNMGIYPAKAAYQYYIDVDPVSFFILFPLLLLGVMALYIFMTSGKFDKSSRKMLYIALFDITTSLYFLTSKGVQHMFAMDGYGWTLVEFIALFTIVLPILLWALETEEKGTWMRKLLAAVTLINIAFVAVATVLNFTNIYHYCRLVLTSCILTFSSGIVLLVFAVRRRLIGRKSDKMFLSGCCIMFISGLADLTRTNLNKYLSGLFIISLPALMPMGVMFMLIYMFRSYSLDNAEQQEKALTAKLEAENLERMLDNTPAGICQLEAGEQLTICSANDIFYSIIGYTKEELLVAGKLSVMAYLYDEGKKALIETYRRMISSGIDTGEVELTTPDREGAVRTLFAKYYYDRHGSGKINVSVIDITDRKRMEEELRLSEERYRLALQQSGKVFFFFDVPTRTMRLSEELAQAFGLPLVVDNMPDNFISQGLVEPESVDNYRHFYERIIAGEKTGDTIISCHMRQMPEYVLWYRIAFTTIFDANRAPASTIITYEDITAQYKAELNAKWKQLNLVSLPESHYVVAEYDLTRGMLLSQTGGLFAAMPEFIKKYEEINDFVLSSFIQEEDIDVYRAFLNRQRLLSMFEGGVSEDAIEYRSMQKGSAYRWTSTSVQMITDPYTHHVMAQFLFVDIHDKKSGQIAMERNMDELQKELDNSRIKVMVNQMQPHFLYNALSAIQTIVKVDPDYAYQLIYDFTVHLRSNIRALSSDAPIPFQDELKNIRAYMNIEQMRFGEDLKVKYEIDCDDFKVIPLSIQPLAENAARHGIYPKGDTGGTVIIRSYEAVSSYIIEVEDDGVGFDINDVLEKKSDSVGLKSLIFRLKSLMNAYVAIDSKLGIGTKVIVTIPKGGADE